MTDSRYKLHHCIPEVTFPSLQVPLNSLQEAEIFLIPGTPSQNPVYPSKGPNDTILCGLIVPPGTTQITTSMFDFEVRDSLGVNSLIAQNQVRFDDRLRPYRNTPTVLGVKPSQNVGSGPFGFTYPGRLNPSKYPLAGGNYSSADSFYDFATGVITGGDSTTPMFSPFIPSGNKSVVCLVVLTSADVLKFNFGNAGGYAQCLAAIQNQDFSGGAGSLPAQDGNFPVAYVIISSFGGAISDIQVIDSRAFLGSGAGAAKFQKEVPVGLVNGSNNLFALSSAPVDPLSLDFYVGTNLLEKSDYTLNGNEVTITNASLIPYAGQSVYASYLISGAVANAGGAGTVGAKFTSEVPSGTVDGTNNVFTLANTPIDPESVFFFVGVNCLESTDYSISGTTITISNSDFIPVPGQSVYCKYLYSGIIPGGGGGGGGSGSSGYVAHGSPGSPILVVSMTAVSGSNDPLQTLFLATASGSFNVGSNPQIRPGVSVGQVIKLKGVDPVNYPIFQDGSGLDLNGALYLKQGQAAELSWNGSVWSEDSRRM